MKTFIKNRNDINIAVIVDEPKIPVNGLAFVAHGQGGIKEQVHIEALKDVFLDNGYRVVRWDAANTIGESGGRMEDVTMTSYYEDLIDVITWAKSQKWYEEPFILCGHSMGGMISALYAEAFPEQVKALIPVSPVVSWGLSMQTITKEFMNQWRVRGYYESPSKSKPGVIKKIPWKYAEDLQQYDLTKNTEKLKMPVLIIVGDKDEGTPLEHQQILFQSIPEGRKTLEVIQGAEHNFRTEEELASLKQLVNNWLKEL